MATDTTVCPQCQDPSRKQRHTCWRAVSASRATPASASPGVAGAEQWQPQEAPDGVGGGGLGPAGAPRPGGRARRAPARWSEDALSVANLGGSREALAQARRWRGRAEVGAKKRKRTDRWPPEREESSEQAAERFLEAEGEQRPLALVGRRVYRLYRQGNFWGKVASYDAGRQPRPFTVVLDPRPDEEGEEFECGEGEVGGPAGICLARRPLHERVAISCARKCESAL